MAVSVCFAVKPFRCSNLAAFSDAMAQSGTTLAFYSGAARRQQVAPR